MIMITKINNKIKRMGLIGLMGLMVAGCADFFDQESEHIIFADKEHLNSATDSIYSVTGILNKLQVIADRTILLGEVRGDLVDVTGIANSDLRDMALFDVKDDNRYNVPRDYYAVINNCNYFIAHADTALKNNRNEYIFMKEYAAVKAIRAWTYLQLALNYGSVPFVTEPILTKIESEASYPRYDLTEICRYFINDLSQIPDRYHREYPGYGTIRGNDVRMMWFPITILLGDLNLWLASATGSEANYREAALRYYEYLSERNGENSAFPTGIAYTTWVPGSTTWNVLQQGDSYIRAFTNESYDENSELITMIPCDSIQAEGYYSQLRNLFNSREENDYMVSLTPSKNMIDISESQEHCCVNTNGTSVLYAPKGMSNHRSGDLRLSRIYSSIDITHPYTGDRIDYQSIDKYSTRNVHIYRRQMVYFRLAEALNMIGYPRMAFQILSQGINNDVLNEEVYPYYSESDSLWISQLSFPTSRYGIYTVENLVSGRSTGIANTIGMHSRGSGWTPMNEFYRLPEDSTKTEAQLMPIQQEYVKELLLTEDALEFSFEGVRYYDLMRFAMREPNPGLFLMSRICNRKGEENSDAMRSELKKDLNVTSNWYIQWNGKLGPQ